MKISIIYFSETGKTEKSARDIADGIRSFRSDIEIGMFNIKDEDSVDKAFVEDSACVIFGTPCYYANMCWQLKRWFDTSFSIDLGGKLGGAFATANVIQGGGNTTILTVLQHMLVKGMIVYASGASCGKPFIHLGPISLRDQIEDQTELFRVFGYRMAAKAADLFE